MNSEDWEGRSAPSADQRWSDRTDDLALLLLALILPALLIAGALMYWT